MTVDELVAVAEACGARFAIKDDSLKLRIPEDCRETVRPLIPTLKERRAEVLRLTEEPRTATSTSGG